MLEKLWFHVGPCISFYCPTFKTPSSRLPFELQVGDTLAAKYVAGEANSSLVLGRLWPLDADCVMRAMCVLYERDASSIVRIFEVAQVRVSELNAAPDAYGAPSGDAAIAVTSAAVLHASLPLCILVHPPSTD